MWLDYFKFQINRQDKTLQVPKFLSAKNFYHQPEHDYTKYIAKRVVRFFIRNGKWYNVLGKRGIHNPDDCSSVLSIVAAKYLHTLYVLNELVVGLCKECEKSKDLNGRKRYSMLRRGTVCYIKPETISCAGEVELNLLGHKSGSITALFNQYFKEPVGEDRIVPGFREDSDIIMGVRVTSYHLERVWTKIFRGPDPFYNEMIKQAVTKMKSSLKLKLLPIAVAIFRMKSYSEKYFDELLSDQSPLRANTTLARIFRYWSVEMTTFEGKITSFLNSPHFNTKLNYRRRHNIAYELVTGRLEASSKNTTNTTISQRI